VPREEEREKPQLGNIPLGMTLRGTIAHAAFTLAPGPGIC